MIVRDAPSDANPFAIAHSRVEGTTLVDEAISALAYALASAGVKTTTVQRVVAAAVQRNAEPQRPLRVIEGLILDALLRANVDRNRKLADTRALAHKLKSDYESPDVRERVAESLDALLRALMHSFMFDRDTVELDAVWAETGAPLRMPLGGEARDLQKAVVEQLGSLTGFAATAHEKAKKSDVVNALLEIARSAPKREKASEDSEPVQLVEAIFSHRVIRQVPDEDGKMRPGSMRVRDLKGIHAADGVAIWDDRRSHRTLLVVHFASLAGRLQNPQFRYRRADELRRIFLNAPGALPDYYSPAKCKEAFGTNRTYALEISVFETQATSGRAVDTSGDDGDDAEKNPASDASNATGDAKTAAQQAFRVAYKIAPNATETLPTLPRDGDDGSVGSVDMFAPLPTNSAEIPTGYVRSVALEASEAPF